MERQWADRMPGEDLVARLEIELGDDDVRTPRGQLLPMHSFRCMRGDGSTGGMPGSSPTSTTSFLHLISADGWLVRFAVPSEEMSRIEPGPTVEVRGNGEGPARRWSWSTTTPPPSCST